MMLRRVGAVLVSLAAASCAEAGPDRSQLEDARRALDRKDVEIRAYQWQIAVLGQELRDDRQRSDARERELWARVQELTAERASLAERLHQAERDRAALAAASPEGAGKDTRASAEAIRRVIAAADARNAQIVEELAHIARALGASRQPDAAPPKGPPLAVDVVDPWGFGSRK